MWLFLLIIIVAFSVGFYKSRIVRVQSLLQPNGSKMIQFKMDKEKIKQAAIEFKQALIEWKLREEYTWHHNAQSAPNNMQLVLENIHNIQAPHTGQNSLIKGK